MLSRRQRVGERDNEHQAHSDSEQDGIAARVTESSEEIERPILNTSTANTTKSNPVRISATRDNTRIVIGRRVMQL